MEVLQFLFAPFVMCLILVGIHCYLGMHVLKRGVIFVDLSLAQVAALGSTVALLFHFEHHSPGAYFISLAHTFVAAGLFAWARKKEDLIPQEVLIGITYALASAASILVVDRMAHGSEHIKEILIGKILWVSWEDVLKTALIYTLVLAVHYKFRHKMFAVSNGEEVQNRERWDFLFFALFGVVITSSVGLAGILLVFAFLIVPALMGKFFYSGLKQQLLFGWGLGFFLSIIGMFVCYIFDLPAGAVLVTLFTLVPLVALPFLKKVHG